MPVSKPPLLRESEGMGFYLAECFFSVFWFFVATAATYFFGVRREQWSRVLSYWIVWAVTVICALILESQ